MAKVVEERKGQAAVGLEVEDACGESLIPLTKGTRQHLHMHVELS